jgi:hypothetical protein
MVMKNKQLLIYEFQNSYIYVTCERIIQGSYFIYIYACGFVYVLNK